MLPDFAVVDLFQQLGVFVDQPSFPKDVGCGVLDLVGGKHTFNPGGYSRLQLPSAPARTKRRGSLLTSFGRSDGEKKLQETTKDKLAWHGMG